MDTGIFWLIGLYVLEAAMFVFTLVLARRFTRSHDRDWAKESVPPAELDGHAGAVHEAQVISGERTAAT